LHTAMPTGAGARKCTCHVAPAASGPWDSIRGLVHHLHAPCHKARKADKCLHFPSPAGHWEGLGPSLLHRAHVPILLALPPDVEGSAILKAPALAVARNRGTDPSRILHVGTSGYFAIPNRASWAARFGFYLFAGMLAGWTLTFFKIGTRKNKWPISAAWAVSAALNCSVSVAIRLGTAPCPFKLWRTDCEHICDCQLPLLPCSVAMGDGG